MLYRVSLAPHSKGSVLDPGRHGAQYRAHKPGSAYPYEPEFTSLLIEIALESARKAAAPGAPSRLHCVFACESYDDAVEFNRQYRRDQGFIYGVKAVAETTSIFRGNFTSISKKVGSVPYVDYLSDWARDYWTKSPDGMVEILVGGPVRIETEVLNR